MSRGSSRDFQFAGKSFHSYDRYERTAWERSQPKNRERSPLNSKRYDPGSSRSQSYRTEGASSSRRVDTNEGVQEALYREYRQQRDFPPGSDIDERINFSYLETKARRVSSDGHYWMRECRARYEERPPSLERGRPSISEGRNNSYHQTYRKGPQSPRQSGRLKVDFLAATQGEEIRTNSAFYGRSGQRYSPTPDRRHEAYRTGRGQRMGSPQRYTGDRRAYSGSDDAYPIDCDRNENFNPRNRNAMYSPSSNMPIHIYHTTQNNYLEEQDIDERVDCSHHISPPGNPCERPRVQKVAPNIIERENDYGLNEEKRKLASKYLNDLLDFSPTDHPGPQGYLERHKKRVSLLRSLKLPNLEDFIFFHIAYRNLPPGNKKDFDETVSRSKIPTFDNVMTFASLARTRPPSEESNDESEDELQSIKFVSETPSLLQGASINNFASSSRSIDSAVCAMCGDSCHTIEHCESFRVLNPQSKYGIVLNQEQCINCLGNHVESLCPSEDSCGICSQRHHPLLHGADFS